MTNPLLFNDFWAGAFTLSCLGPNTMCAAIKDPMFVLLGLTQPPLVHLKCKEITCRLTSLHTLTVSHHVHHHHVVNLRAHTLCVFPCRWASLCRLYKKMAYTLKIKWLHFADGLHFADDYGKNSSLLATHLATGVEKDANLALLTGDLAYAL